MTQDDIIEMARNIATTLGSRMCDENGDTHGEELYCMAFDDIVDSIKLVAAKVRKATLEEMIYEHPTTAIEKAVAYEREACAKVCDDINAEYEAKDSFSSYAEAIRARSEV